MYEIEKYFEYDSAEEMLKAWKDRYDGFHTKLQAELCEFFFSYWPEMGGKRELIIQDLRKLAVYSCQDAYFNLLETNKILRMGLPLLGDYSLPKAKSRDKEEKELEELLAEFPHMKKKVEFIKSYWENFEQGVKVDTFFFQTHLKIKEVLVEFYCENINKFEGDHLRFIDCQLYYMSSYPFSQGSLKLMYKAEEPGENQSDHPAGEPIEPST